MTLRVGLKLLNPTLLGSCGGPPRKFSIGASEVSTTALSTPRAVAAVGFGALECRGSRMSREVSLGDQGFSDSWCSAWGLGA